jgi:peptidyl-prolyl cis-trans isomerase B (cyclophilin B)
VASSRSRQRKLARDRYERQLARRAQRQRRRRQIQAAVGAFLLVGLIVTGTVWLVGGFEPEPPAAAEPERCTWLPREPSPERIEAGIPQANPEIFGDRVVSLDIDAGPAGAGEVELSVVIDVDPCAVASLEHLAAQGFYDGTTCHEISFGALRCGDPSGTGRGGPAYAFSAGENIPLVPDGAGDGDDPDGGDAPLVYPAGTVAFGETTGGGGSQFMIFYQDFHTDSPLWSVIGEVTRGLDLIQAIGAAGTAEDSVAPREEVTIQAVRVVDPHAPGAVDGS